jgi:hypothetical protein
MTDHLHRYVAYTRISLVSICQAQERSEADELEHLVHLSPAVKSIPEPLPTANDTLQPNSPYNALDLPLVSEGAQLGLELQDTSQVHRSSSQASPSSKGGPT